MTKKAAARTRLEFPAIVLEAKERLKKGKNKYLPVMRKLTENPHREDDLKKMWIALEKAEKKSQRGGQKSTDDIWPHFFVGMVSAFSTMPPYYYQTKSKRKALLEGLKKHSGQLTKLLQRNRMDYRLAHSDKSKALDIYERLDFLDNWHADKSTLEKPPVSEVLKRLMQYIETEMKNPKNLRVDDHTEARQFVYHLARHLKRSYGTPMNAVLATATAAIYGVEYDEDDIRKILKR